MNETTSEAAPTRPESENSFSPRFWFGAIDLRPAGLFRIALGCTSIAAVLDLGPALFDLLSDDGVMPRSALLGGIARYNRFSIFDLAGPKWLLAALWLATLFALFCFIVGYRTRLATVASFFLVTGLHERNLQVFDGADNVIRVMLFWSMFIDLGGRFSVDAEIRMRAKAPPRDSGWAFPVRMAQLQFAWIYLDSVIWKFQGQYWHKGEALRFALGLNHLFTRTLGARLFDARWFIVPASYSTLGIEAAFLFLVFAPFWQPKLRAVGLLSGLGLHGGIWLLMNVGNFSYVMLSCYPLFFEPAWGERVVEWAERRIERVPALTRARTLVARFTAWSAAAYREVPSLFERFPSLRQFTRQVASPVAVGIFLSCVWFTLPEKLTGHPMPQPLHDAVQELELWQSWDMFAPDPMNTDSWLKSVGHLADGVEIDPLRGEPAGPLPTIYPHFYFSRWTKLMNALGYADQATLLQFGRFICRRWNSPRPTAGKPLKDFKIYRVERKTSELGQPLPDWSEVLIWEHRCY
jgi:Vitamin K-dependent gamma-carboxylase